jgi:hypothetical protein
MLYREIIAVLTSRQNTWLHLYAMQKVSDVKPGVGARGGVVVKALRYKPAGRGFDSRWCHWNFSVT